MISAVYKIISKSTGLFYIGGSTQLKRRWKKHFYDLDKGLHHSFKLQELYNKVGKSDFYLDIIEECKSEEVSILEQKYLDMHDISKLLNVSKNAIAGDLISYHPKRDLITVKTSESLNKRYKQMTREERSFVYGMKGDENPNWKGGVSIHYCDCGNKMSYYVDRCIKCTDKTGENNPFFGKLHSDKSKKLISDKNKGRLPINTKRVSVNGIEYDSGSEASRIIGCSTATIFNRIRRGVEGYKLIN